MPKSKETEIVFHLATQTIVIIFELSLTSHETIYEKS